MLTNLTIMIALLLSVVACSSTDNTKIDTDYQYSFKEYRTKSKNSKH